MYWRIFLVVCLILGSFAVSAGSIYQAEVSAPADRVQMRLTESLEARRLWNVFEADLGANLQRMAGRLGEDYNRNGLEAMRMLVVCNPIYANDVSNLDPAMLALCPLHVALYSKQGKTTVVFARPTLHAAQSAALPVIAELEGLVIEAIDEALAKAGNE